MDVDVKFTEHIQELMSAMNQKSELILETIGSRAEGYAAKDCPVDTGRLRGSIDHAVDDDEKAVYIGTNVEYAVYVEYNDHAHHETGKAHFLRDAATTHSREYKGIAELILKQP